MIKFDFFTKNSNKQIVLAALLTLMLLFLLSYIFLYKKDIVKREAQLNSQTVHLTINSEENQPVIAIVLNAVGSIKTEVIYDLPTNVTIGVPSYLKFKSDKQNFDRSFIMNIPSDEINLSKELEQEFNYQAIYTSYDDTAILSDEETTENFLKFLQDNKFIYLCGTTNQETLPYKLAEKLDFNILKNNLVLDEIISEESINLKLQELEKIAQESGSAIAIGSLYPTTIDAVKEWVAKLSNKNIILANIKDFYNLVNKKNQKILSKELFDE